MEEVSASRAFALVVGLGNPKYLNASLDAPVALMRARVAKHVHLINFHITSRLV